MTRQRSTSRRLRIGALTGAGAVLVGAGLAGLSPGGATASSHREAPGITDLPKYDNTDVYAFVSPDRASSVTIVANWIPMEEPAGGPNFYPWATDAAYDVHIDNDHDAKADLTYRWTFTDARVPSEGDSFSGNGTFLYNNGQVTSLTDENLLFRQTYDLTLIGEGGASTLLLDDAPVAPSHVGNVSMPDYDELQDAAVTAFTHQDGTSRSFAGQSEDPFFLDLRVFDLLYGDQGTCNKEIGNDTLNGYNVNALAIQVPKQQLVKGPDVGTEPVIGVWSTTSRKNASGAYVQVSRLGNPLVNEVVVPYKVKDTFNAIDPTQDGAALPFVLEPELGYLLKNVCGVAVPNLTDRQDLVQVFLKGVPGVNLPNNLQAPSEQLRLNVNKFTGQKFSRLGVIGGDLNGFPNGRRLKDDVVDIALQVVGGELIGNANNLGDAVDRNASGFDDDFPYLALPHSGSVEQSSPPAKSGETLLTGGDGRGPAGTFPTGSVAVVALGGLLLIAAAGLARRTGVARPSTA
ncbi:MAG: DUF4331 domain-containing protein [Actinomycetes bacterium]